MKPLSAVTTLLVVVCTSQSFAQLAEEDWWEGRPDPTQEAVRTDELGAAQVSNIETEPADQGYLLQTEDNFQPDVLDDDYWFENDRLDFVPLEDDVSRPDFEPMTPAEAQRMEESIELLEPDRPLPRGGNITETELGDFEAWYMKDDEGQQRFYDSLRL